MGAQKHSETEILKLGKLLIEELGLGDRSDTLSRWISHYLAEKITTYETLGTGQEKDALGNEIFDLIMQLWNRNKVFQHTIDPLLNIQNAIRNLNSLNRPESRSQFFEHPLFDYKKKGTRADEFIESLKETYLDVANAIVIASLLPDHLKKSIKWREDFDGLLSEEEKKVIDMLHLHLENYRSEQKVFLKEVSQTQKEEEDILFLDYVLATIGNRLEQTIIDFQSVKDASWVTD